MATLGCGLVIASTYVERQECPCHGKSACATKDFQYPGTVDDMAASAT
jgi:hypothetical protein